MTYSILALIIAGSMIGDYLIKLASNSEAGLANGTFWLGATLYGLTAIGWFFLMRHHSLASIAILYSAASIVFLAALGFFVFKEPLSGRDILGMALAIAALVVMGKA